jgi:hypothetical protein
MLIIKLPLQQQAEKLRCCLVCAIIERHFPNSPQVEVGEIQAKRFCSDGAADGDQDRQRYKKFRPYMIRIFGGGLELAGPELTE